MKHLISSEEIEKIFPNIPILKTSDLTRESLDNPYNAVVILYESRENFGHWTALIKTFDSEDFENGKLTECLEFFDSYGFKPDEQMKFIKNSKFFNLNVSKTMLKSKERLTFNEHKFQKLKKDINTCGRHVITRIMLNFLPLSEYKKILNTDEKVLKLSKYLLHKEKQ